MVRTKGGDAAMSAAILREMLLQERRRGQGTQQLFSQLGAWRETEQLGARCGCEEGGCCNRSKRTVRPRQRQACKPPQLPMQARAWRIPATAAGVHAPHDVGGRGAGELGDALVLMRMRMWAQAVHVAAACQGAQASGGCPAEDPCLAGPWNEQGLCHTAIL